jgi:hypothetical protein
LLFDLFFSKTKIVGGNNIIFHITFAETSPC